MIKEEIWGVARPGVDEFFEAIGSPIREFASNHNLKIEKYYRNIDGWQLVFQHPQGGACYIEITKEDEHNILILADWWVDDYETQTRADKHTRSVQCSTDRSELSKKLNEIFIFVLSWEMKDLVSYPLDPYTDYKRKMSKEDFEKDLDRYPVPKL